VIIHPLNGPTPCTGLILLGLGGSNSTPWYYYLFLVFAIFGFFPILCLSELRIKVSWKSVIWLEASVVCLTVLSFFLLRLVYAGFRWHVPVYAFIFVLIVRVVVWVGKQLFAGEIGDD